MVPPENAPAGLSWEAETHHFAGRCCPSAFPLSSVCCAAVKLAEAGAVPSTLGLCTFGNVALSRKVNQNWQ